MISVLYPGYRASGLIADDIQGSTM